jgi:hypothetical protein
MSIGGRALQERSRIVTVWFAVLLGLGLVGLPQTASARDTDGSRLGAQAIEVGASASDTLTPPEDGADWRYIKVESAGDIEISLQAKPGDRPVTLKLTKATGDELESARTDAGSATIARSLQPGLYYIEVSSAEKVSYTISVE